MVVLFHVDEPVICLNHLREVILINLACELLNDRVVLAEELWLPPVFRWQAEQQALRCRLLLRFLRFIKSPLLSSDGLHPNVLGSDVVL